jgi:hypothetical protein
MPVLMNSRDLAFIFKIMCQNLAKNAKREDPFVAKDPGSNENLGPAGYYLSK